MLERFGRLVFIGCFLVAFSPGVTEAGSQLAGIDIRAENFTVPPSTGPLTHILVRNTGDTTSAITVLPKFPDGWGWTPKERTVSIESGQTHRLAFAIEKAADSASNQYAIEITVHGSSQTAIQRQTIVCASAPYFKPKIDGNFKDWADAIPATFTTKEKKTTVSTYWNKKQFCLYVQVEEDELRLYRFKAGYDLAALGETGYLVAMLLEDDGHEIDHVGIVLYIGNCLHLCELLLPPASLLKLSFCELITLRMITIYSNIW